MEGMISVALSEEERKEKQDTLMGESPKYPYGLNFTLEDDVVKKLGITEAPTVGDKLHIMAMVEVSAVRLDNDSKDDVRDFSISLQITDIGLKSEEEKEKKKDVVTALYGEG